MNSISQQKLAERLFILNDRQLGVLTRLHYMKQLLSSKDYRPLFMPGGDKIFDLGWKTLLKKFPSIDIKQGQSNMQPFIKQKEIFSIISTYYFNLVDVLEVRDHFNDFMGCISSSQMVLDITINFDLTRIYLELVSNYFAMMFIITRIYDVKAILILFNFLYNQLNGAQEKNFPRMAQLFVDSTDAMLNNMHLDINPHSRTLSRALHSLSDFYIRRVVRAQNWTDCNFLNILHEPSKITHTVLGDQLACELIPYEVMERWVVFSYLLIFPELAEEESFNRLKIALKHSYVVVLFREEVIHIHALLQSFLESCWTAKIAAKRISEIKETFNIACTQTAKIHADRRSYLRLALRQMHLMLSDEPGLLGPKAFLVFWGLSYASDEVHWLLRHLANPNTKKKGAITAVSGGCAVVCDEFSDPFLPELLFIMDELRSLVMRYAPIIQRFYLQLLACHDGPGLDDYLHEIIPKLGNDEAVIFQSIAKQLCDLTDNPLVKDSPANANLMFDFSGIRLDWLRLQVSLSCATASSSSSSSPSVSLFDYPHFVKHFHSTVLHTKMVDYLDELLRFVSDMSIFLFYQTQMVDMFNNCRMCPAQLRFTVAFPSICSQAIQACHDLCPEERCFLGRLAIYFARLFCTEMADRVCFHLFNRIDEFGGMADQLAPHLSIPWLLDEHFGKQHGKKYKKANQTKAVANGGGGAFDLKRSGLVPKGLEKTHLPGFESFRVNREDQTAFDKTLFGMGQLCFAINHHREFVILDQVINPREILQNEIQLRLIDVLTSYTTFTPNSRNDDADDPLITKPSELLRRVRALMSVLLDLENHVNIDVISVFSNVLGQHTQYRDAFRGQPTMTAHYTKWYTDHLIQHAYKDHFVYSPLLKSFVTLVSPDVVRFRAEDYADLNELLALAELIGPLGIRYICERFVQSIGDRIDEIKNLVLRNRAVLESLRESFDNSAKTRQLSATLQNSDRLLVVLKEIGVALAFRMLCMEALNQVMERRAPFLLDSVRNLRSHVLNPPAAELLPEDAKMEMEQIYARFNDHLAINNLSASMGIYSPMDYSLCVILNNRRMASLAAASQAGLNHATANGMDAGYPELDYHIACLFVVFVANALPLLARQEHSLYHLDLEANENNCHCIAYSVNTLMVCMFSLLRPGDLEARSKEFLALASSNMLRLGLESSTSVISSDIGAGSGGPNSANSAPNFANQLSNSSTVTSPPAKHRDSIYIVFDQIFKLSPCLSANLQESCFPYSLIRSAYHNVAKLTGPAVAEAVRTNDLSQSIHVESK